MLGTIEEKMIDVQHKNGRVAIKIVDKDKIQNITKGSNIVGVNV